MTLRIEGEVVVPGDKSISHRALMLAAVAEGESVLRGLLPGEDCRSTAAVLQALGTPIPHLPSRGEEVRIRSAGLDAWIQPTEALDCGNSGTTARLMLGLLAGRPLCATLTGDASLRQRPMRRVTEPLARMGARLRELGPSDRLPIEVCGGDLSAISYRSPKASAQIKSAILLAAVSAGVPAEVVEPLQSRDHTERMLRGLGLSIAGEETAAGWKVSLAAVEHPLPPLELTVPGDPSSAAFFLALGTLADRGELCIRRVGMNPTRTGFLHILTRMGGQVQSVNEREEAGEPVADLVVRPAELRGTTVTAEEIPAAIDEIPVLAVLAARASGETRIHGAEELRVKETDRIAALVENIRAIGVEGEQLPDGLVVRGSDQPLLGRVRTFGDHRIAMAFGVLAAMPHNEIELSETESAAVSFPGFWPMLHRLTQWTPASAGRPALRG